MSNSACLKEGSVGTNRLPRDVQSAMEEIPQRNATLTSLSFSMTSRIVRVSAVTENKTMAMVVKAEEMASQRCAWAIQSR